MDKLKMQSPNLVDANIDKIADLFPNCITEDRDENGILHRVVDFDLLRQELSRCLVEGTQERYTLSWPGKNEAILTANAPIAKTLRPCEEESVDFEKTKNIYIEGDNLDALKLLQETYLNKVKMIYIDPPYNTGHDFIYNDDFAEDTEEFLKRSKQKDEEGNRLVTNSESNGRFHSDWLTMMYPRLKLARNLLGEDGVIFISIDDNEAHNLRKMCDEIFGEKNFITSIIWQKKVSPSNDAKWFSSDHDEIFIYSKNKEVWRPNRLAMNEKQISYYQNPDNDVRGQWNSSTYTCNKTKDERPNLYYPLTNPNTGEEIWPSPNAVWAYSKDVYKRHVMDNLIYWGKEGKSTKPRFKKFLTESKLVVPRTIWPYSEVGSTQTATQSLRELLPEIKFETPKPPDLINKMLMISTQPGSSDIVMDFFSGSGTTSLSVLELNNLDGGNRKFIMAQLPEPCDEKSDAYRAGYKTIAEIGKERIRRAGKKIKEENQITAKNLDTGFRVFKVDTSNMSDVYYTPDELKRAQILSSPKT